VAQPAPQLLEREAGREGERAAADDRPAPGPVPAFILAVVDVERHGLQGDRRARRGQSEHQQRLGLPGPQEPPQLAVRVPEMHGEDASSELARDLAAWVDALVAPGPEARQQDIHV
jgi:hypothetical protein